MLKICPQCGNKFEGRPLAVTCSPACRKSKSRNRGKRPDHKLAHLPFVAPNQCFPNAIAVITGMTVEDVILIVLGGVCKHGYRHTDYIDVLAEMGFQQWYYPRGKLTDSEAIPATGKYLVCVHRHAYAVIDGNRVETHNSELRRKRIISCFLFNHDTHSKWRLRVGLPNHSSGSGPTDTMIV